MADDERLVVLLEARIRDFERNMQKAGGTARRNFGDMRRGSQSATRAMEDDMARSMARINQLLASTSARMGSFAKSFGSGFLGGLTAGSLDNIVAAAGNLAKSIATVGDEAKRAGLSTKAFQELKFVAEQNRVGVDSLVDGIKELNLRADEWITTGAGPAAEAFQRLGYTATELKDKLRDPSALFTEIIGKLQQLDKAAQIRIADEIFGGTGGEKFVQLIEQGERGIRAQIKAANDLGIVLDEQVIKRAAEIDAKFNAVSATISGWVQPKVISFLTDVLSLMERVKPIDQQMDTTLDADMRRIDMRRLEIESETKRLEADLEAGKIGIGDGWFGTGVGETTILERIQELQREDEALAENERRIMNVVKARQAENAAMSGTPAPTAGIPFNPLPATDMTRQVGLAAAREQIARQESAGSGGYRAIGPVTDNGDRAYGRYQVMGSNIGPWSRQALGTTLTIDQFLNNPAMQDAIFDKIFGSYLDKFGMEGAGQAWFGGPGAVGKTGRTDVLGTSLGEYGKKFADGMREAGGAVGELADRWEGLRTATADVSGIRAQQAAYDQLGQVAGDALNGIASALADGKLEGREVLQIVIDIVQQLLRMPTPGAAGGSLAGSLFGGIGSLFGFSQGAAFNRGSVVRFADGGVFDQPTTFPMSGGRTGLMAEAGPEAIMPLRRGSDGRLGVSAPRDERRQREDSRQDVHVTVGVKIDRRDGTIMPFVADVSKQVTKKGIADYDKGMGARFDDFMERGR